MDWLFGLLTPPSSPHHPSLKRSSTHPDRRVDTVAFHLSAAKWTSPGTVSNDFQDSRLGCPPLLLVHNGPPLTSLTIVRTHLHDSHLFYSFTPLPECLYRQVVNRPSMADCLSRVHDSIGIGSSPLHVHKVGFPSSPVSSNPNSIGLRGIRTTGANLSAHVEDVPVVTSRTL